jgi:protein-L-isoaspartate(D-aspartate) O-methyltransferase
VTDYHLARKRMVERQIAARGIRSPAVIRALTAVPRHLFVEEALRDRAYGDFPLPIGLGQTISQPYMVALMTEALELSGIEKVLEIGTGSGYQTAVLAELADRIITVERIPELARRARDLLEHLGCHRVFVTQGDGTVGWKDGAPYDAILVTAGSPEVPDDLIDQLGKGGRLVIPVGSRDLQRLKRITRTSEGLHEEDLGGCMFVPLLGKKGWQSGGG